MINQFLKTRRGMPVIVRAICSGFLVSTLGIAIWSLFLILFMPPWPVLPMMIALWAYWKFVTGRWGSGTGAVSKKECFRKEKLSLLGFKWALAGAASFVLIIQASFVITFRIREFPIVRFASDYKILNTMTPWIAWVILIMSSAVAGICEETGYRGYLQVPLEKKYGPTIAIIVSSIVFTSVHLSKAWALPILPNIFFASILLGILAFRSGSLIPGIIGHSVLDIFDYSIWWTNLTGGFKKQTIFKTGVDLHFITWILIFILGLFVFFKAIDRLKKHPV